MTPFFLVYFRYARGGREHAPRQGRPDRRLQPPQLPRPLRDRRHPALAAADELRRQGRAVRAPLAGLDPLPARRLPDPPRRVRRGLGRDRAAWSSNGAARSASSPRAPGSAAARSATPKRGVGRLALQTGAPVIPTAVLGTEDVRRGWRIRPRKVRVRLGRAMTFPRAAEPLAGAGRDGHGADLAQRRAAVGGPRRPAADAPRRGDRRRQLGHRRRRPARPRRPRRPARHPHRRAGGRAERRPREPPLPARRRRCPDRCGCASRARSSSPASTSSASRSPPARCRRRSARSPTGSATAPPSCC